LHNTSEVPYTSLCSSPNCNFPEPEEQPGTGVIIPKRKPKANKSAGTHPAVGKKSWAELEGTSLSEHL